MTTQLGVWLRRGSLVALPVVLVATSAVAAPEAHGASAGLPQLNPAYFLPQIFWLAVTFGVLYVIMSRVGLPQIERTLEKRRSVLAEDLDRATALRDQAGTIITNYEATMADSRRSAQDLISAATADAAKHAVDQQSALSARLTAQTQVAETRIAEAKKAGLANIQAVAAEVAADIAQRLAGVSVSREEIEKAVAGLAKERA